MTDVAVVTTETPAPIETPAVVEAEKAHAEARVEVASIEAERDKAIAETHAEVDKAAIDAAKETVTEKFVQELAICQQNIGTIQTEVSGLKSALSLIQGQLEALAKPPNPSESVALVVPEKTEQSAPEPKPKAKQPHRWI